MKAIFDVDQMVRNYYYFGAGLVIFPTFVVSPRLVKSHQSPMIRGKGWPVFPTFVPDYKTGKTSKFHLKLRW